MSISRKDSLLLAWANNFTSCISAVGNPYELATAKVAEMTDRTAAYATSYNVMMASRANGVRSAIETAEKTRNKALLLELGRELYALVSANSSITDAEKVAAGVHVRTARSRVPAPTDRPGMDILSVVDRTIEVNIHAGIAGASGAKRARPAGAVQAMVYFFAGESYPSDPNLWDFAGLATKAKFQFIVPETVAGGTRVWVCAAWTNRSGEPGPKGVPVATAIQGTGGIATSGATVDATMKVAA